MVAAVVAALAGSACTQASSATAGPVQPAVPHRIVSNIYFVGTSDVGVFLITTRDGHILVDAGPEVAVPMVAAGVTALGYRYEDLRVLLSSHAHAEHAGGLARIKRETGAQVMAMAEAAPLLARGGRDDPHVGDARTFAAVGVDRVLSDGDAIEFGGRRLLARYTPGHAPGAATFTTTVQENGRALQMVFAASTALEPSMQLAANPRYPGAIADWQRTYAVLESMVADVWVSGHTAEFDMAGKLQRAGASSPNPYLDPQGYRRHLSDSRAAFNARLASELSGR
jgi:metallo-beta-lactamase class B